MSLFVLMTGLLVLFGWVFDLEFLKTGIQGAVTMKPLTALCFIFDGTSYYLLTQRKNKFHWDLLIMASAIISFTIMSIALICAILGIPEITEFIFHDDNTKTIIPGVPSLATMLLFFITSFVAMICLTTVNAGKFIIVSGVFVALCALCTIIGYLTDISSMYYYLENKSTAMAVHTAALFTLVGCEMVNIGIRKQKYEFVERVS